MEIFRRASFPERQLGFTLRSENESGVTPPSDVGLQTRLTALGFHVNRDTRPNRFYPDKGTWLDFTSMFFSHTLGSKYSFESYRVTFNYYHAFGTRQVLAYNLFNCATAGDAPFYGECIYGTNNELRGYVAGRYIDTNMLATHAEYRVTLPWRFGMVAFGGLGEVAPGLGEFQFDHLLPAGGGGLRFKISKNTTSMSASILPREKVGTPLVWGSEKRSRA